MQTSIQKSKLKVYLLVQTKTILCDIKLVVTRFLRFKGKTIISVNSKQKKVPLLIDYVQTSDENDSTRQNLNDNELIWIQPSPVGNWWTMQLNYEKVLKLTKQNAGNKTRYYIYFVCFPINMHYEVPGIIFD